MVMVRLATRILRRSKQFSDERTKLESGAQLLDWPNLAAPHL